MAGNTLWIDYGILQFHFNWSEIKDKELHLKGDSDSGVLIILNTDGTVYKMFGYERIDEEDE